MITHDINVLIGADNPGKKIEVKCHDTGVNLCVFLNTMHRLSLRRSREEAYTIPAGCTAVLKMARPDKTCVLQDGKCMSTSILFSFKPDQGAFNVPGESEAEVNIFGPDGRRITTATFCIEVTKEAACDCEQAPGGYVDILAEQIKAINEARDAVTDKMGGYTWRVDTDKVINSAGKDCGTLANCMTDTFVGTWFYVRTTSSEAGSHACPSRYTIDGSNGFLNLRGYVIWTGSRLVYINPFEAKASTLKNADGKYSPASGVDGLFSSTAAAYLSDLINVYWGKDHLRVFPTPTPNEGWQVNWLFDQGWYLGGIKKDCGGHPPVINNNHTSWAVLVLNGMNTGENGGINRNHRVQIAFDLVNSRIYMRRGWMSSNTWAGEWTDVAAIDRITDLEQKVADLEKKLNS